MKEFWERWKAGLGRFHSRLVNRYHCYAVFCVALGDFREKDLRYHTYYFTVNAFMGVLAMFVAVSSLLGFLAESEVKRQLVEGMQGAMPILRGSSDETLNIFRDYRGWAAVISFLFLLWASTRIFSALEHGFSVVWGSPKRRYAQSLLAGLFMVLVIGVLFLLTLEIQLSFNGLWGEIYEAGSPGYYAGVAVAKPLIALLIDFLMFLFLYRVVTGVHPRMRHCAAAAALAAVLFLATQYLLNLYFDMLYRVPVVYGSLASGIVVILWMQWTGLLTFYGAELIYVLQNEPLVREYREKHPAP